MARPPRIPVWLPLDQTVTYFVTILCRRPSASLEQSGDLWRRSSRFCDLQEEWETLAAVVMPDHFHALVRPLANRDAKITQYSAGLKRFVRRETKAAWKWQDGVFDRLLRRRRIGRIEMDLHAGKSRPRRAGEALGGLAIRDRLSRVGRAILAAPGEFGSVRQNNLNPGKPGRPEWHALHVREPNS